MRSRVIAAAAVLAALVVAAPAMAQQRGGFGGGFGGGFRGMGGGGLVGLLQIEEVRKEIELLDDQQAEIQKIVEEARSRRGDGPRLDFQALRDLSQEEREKRLAEFRAQAEKRAQETEAKVKEVLLPHQVERLEQLAIQQQGVRALADPDVQAKLNLSDEQKQKIASIQEDQGRRLREAFGRRGRGEGDRPNFNPEEFRAQAQRTESELLAVLSDEQKKQFEELKGEPFTFPERRFGAFGQGGRRGGGEGRGPRGEGGRGRPQSDN